jgi:hypothetical protein
VHARLAVIASLTCGDERRAKRNSEMVQRDEGLRFRPAGRRWRQGVFVSAIEKAGVPREGDKVTFDILANRGKERAENLKVK